MSDKTKVKAVITAPTGQEKILSGTVTGSQGRGEWEAYVKSNTTAGDTVRTYSK
jgi:hypothetical protein